MRKRTGHRRLVRGVGAFVSATLIAGGALIGVGAGAASAQVSADEGVGTFVLAPNTAPSNIRQNTRANYVVPQSGAGAGWTFTLQGDWDSTDYIDISAFPGNYDGTRGVQCKIPYDPSGMNQSYPDNGNWVGFDGINLNNFPGGPQNVRIESTFPAGIAPQFNIYPVGDPIGCSAQAGRPTYQTLRLDLRNSGNGQANQLAIVHLGWSEEQPPPPGGPVVFNVGPGATTGPVHFVGGGSMGSFAIESSVTVIGQRPSANSPRSTLVRNTATDKIAGPISEFKITENVYSSLPPSDGYAPFPISTTEDLQRHVLDTHVPGYVCLSIDNSNGNGIIFGSNPGWSVDPGASASPNSAAAGALPGPVLGAGTDRLLLPVTEASNTQPTTWTTTGLNLAGTALTDGPVWAWVTWAQFPTEDDPGWDCDGNPIQLPGEVAPDVKSPVTSIATLGYVQLTTVSEVANSVFGNNAVATSAQAINHQFDYAKGDCISNTAGRDFTYGPSIFLGRDDYFADVLGAAYAAGSVESGVLLTPTNSLDPRAKDTIRLQGAQTVFVLGGPLAVSDAVVNELKDTISYQCGGTSPRLDPNTGLPKKLVVIRIAGDTVWDTNARLAEFVGAEPPGAFGPFGANNTTLNPFNTAGGISQAGTPPGGWVNTALLVTGENFQDAMVASVAAYGGWAESPIGTGGPMPLIATRSNSLTQQAVDAMFNQHIQQLIVVGGPLAVSDNVINQALAAVPGLSVIRVAGMNASETSTNLAAFELSVPLGMGWRNVDFAWDNYVNRTAGNINFNTNGEVTAHVVLMARGDWWADGTAAAAVLSVHNGRYNWCEPEADSGTGERESRDCAKFPLIITESPTSLGTAVTTFLQKGSLYISGLTGAIPSGGNAYPVGGQYNNHSSNVFTIQPIGGPLALNPSILSQAAKVIGS